MKKDYRMCNPGFANAGGEKRTHEWRKIPRRRKPPGSPRRKRDCLSGSQPARPGTVSLGGETEEKRLRPLSPFTR
jgi:hypothetical protein